MQIHRTLFIGVILAATGLLIPHDSFAQQAGTSQRRNEEENTPSTSRPRTEGQGGRRGADVAAGGGEDAGQTGGGGVNVQVVATADDRTNSVVVRGPAEILDLVADVLKALDDTTAKVAHVKVYQLRYADALNTADVINELFGQNH